MTFRFSHIRAADRSQVSPVPYMEPCFGILFDISDKRGMIIRRDILYNYKVK